ncbi:unnamed protein product [Microthlaspi erraticum]|uniref:Uncharacterized protein n=1 Tax=Microthlaspi erraticum TaxID=1685480 RepID=A0A6D2HX06_9BRAS|nr:unnamed protein product [Microthlaspi erraticum]
MLSSHPAETLDMNLIMKDYKKKRITKADLCSWAKDFYMDGKPQGPQYALKILEWMDQKEMKFSASQLELYMDVLCKIKGVEAGTNCFQRLKPDFDQNNTRARNNSPAYWILITWMEREMVEASRPKTRSPIFICTREETGFESGRAYFEKVEPDFDENNTTAKNVPTIRATRFFGIIFLMLSYLYSIFACFS